VVVGLSCLGFDFELAAKMDSVCRSLGEWREWPWLDGWGKPKGIQGQGNPEKRLKNQVLLNNSLLFYFFLFV
jgi:hypothetical protein